MNERRQYRQRSASISSSGSDEADEDLSQLVAHGAAKKFILNASYVAVEEEDEANAPLPVRRNPRPENWRTIADHYIAGKDAQRTIAAFPIQMNDAVKLGAKLTRLSRWKKERFVFISMQILL